MVKNVTQTIKNGEYINLSSEPIRSFALDWNLWVKTSINHISGEAIRYVGVFLFVEGDFSKEYF